MPGWRDALELLCEYWTQAEVAALVGRSDRAVRAWVAGAVEPEPAVKRRLVVLGGQVQAAIDAGADLDALYETVREGRVP